MNTEQTAQQFELAAKLIRTGHPWKSSPQAPDTDIYSALRDGFEIRPVLATPPDNRPLHNPDNLTAEQVGVGYRLLCAEDGVPSGKVDTWMFGGWCSAYVVDKKHLHECDKTYRLPLSVPWPPAPVDPYAELKAAHAAGKVIQGLIGGHWIDCPHPTWKYPVNTYREKPEVPDVCVFPQIIKNTPFQLPPPPPGMSWHRTDGWQEGDLPNGWRPLALSEAQQKGDEFRGYGGWREISDVAAGDVTFSGYSHRRTTRPLTFTHAGKTWTYHRPGDPMPCDGGKQVVLLRYHREEFATNEYSALGKEWTWDDDTIIGWRYADKKKTVPLEDETIADLSDDEIIKIRRLLKWFDKAFLAVDA